MFIVVPYADLRPEQRRSFQFKEFVRHMREHCEILLQHSDVHIIISEQCMPKSLFNRGQLINLGIYWGVQTYGEPDKVIMHDVDLLPNPTLIREYSAPYEARMLLPNSETHKKSYGFEIEFGGAISGMKYANFVKANGFPNFFWGWGGEDNAIAQRVKRQNIKVTRVKRGDYSNIDVHHMDSKLKYLKANKLRSMVVWENLAEDKKQYNMDGYAQIPDTNAVNLTHTQLFTGEHRQHIITIDLVTWQLDQTKLRESIKKNDIVYSQIARSHQRPKKSSNKYK